ncbi:MAG TPA: condensation domain-containing protein, partial [Puia sp.]|nr:condensation domain-containing protein [Puia sp.]
TMLAAYLTAGDRPGVGELRSWLLRELPEYMVPAIYVRMERLPLSPHGKIDRNRLPQPGQEGELLGTDYHAATTTTEKDLVVLWEEILGVSPIGIKDNFFEKGGHSLKATRLAGELYRRMGVKVSLGELLRRPVLQDQAVWIESLNKEVFETIPPAPEAAAYPLSSAQRRIWFLSRLEAGSAAYNMPGFYLLEGLSDRIPVRRVIEKLLERHEILRTVFREDDRGEQVQMVLPAGSPASGLEWCDWREKSSEEIEALVDAFAGWPFDLATGPLIRFQIAELSDRQSLLCFSMHHIVGDEWSMGVLITDLLGSAGGNGGQNGDRWKPLPIQYKDYAVWEKRQLGTAVMAGHRAYWLEKLKGDLPVLQLPEDKQRPRFRSFEGDQISFLIPGEVRDALAAFCRWQDATLFMGLMTALNMLLYRLSGQEDIIIGTTVTGRDHPGLADQIGIFLHSLALRTKLNRSEGFGDLLGKVKQVTLEGFQHQAFPFDRLVEELAISSDGGRNPVFDVSFVGMDAGSGLATGVFRGMTIRPYGERAGKFSKFDWTVGFRDAMEGLQMTFEFNTAIYTRETMLRWADHFGELLKAGLADTEAAIGGLAMMKKEEKTKLLEMSQGDDRRLVSGETVLDMFERWARSAPDAVAQVTEGKTLSYQELDALSERLALWLHYTYGVVKHDRVGILMPRNEWLVAVPLATLKLGAAYVPINPTYPKERIARLIDQSGCRVIVDMESIGRFAADDKGSSQPTGWPEERRKPMTTDLAYVIYTSGSTGEPKGCAITHGNLLHYIEWANRNYFSKEAKGDFGLCTSLSFDLTVTSIFCPLTMGRRITVFGSDVSVEEMMMRQFQPGSGIDSVKLTPSHVSLLRHLELTATGVQCAILGGEQVTPAQVAILKTLNPEMRVYNEYGPTETTVGCVVKELESGTPIVIGRPIDRTSAYVLNEFGQLCPPGVAGELYIGGDGVGQGYLNAPELTS